MRCGHEKNKEYFRKFWFTTKKYIDTGDNGADIDELILSGLLNYAIMMAHVCDW